MPTKYSLPPAMEEAILVFETGWTSEQLDNAPENLINNILLYKAIKNVSQNGGELQI